MSVRNFGAQSMPIPETKGLKNLVNGWEKRKKLSAMARIEKNKCRNKDRLLKNDLKICESAVFLLNTISFLNAKITTNRLRRK